MTAIKFQRLGDFRRAIGALLGYVLPEFRIAYGFHTFTHSLIHTPHIVFVASLLQGNEEPAHCVSRIAKPPSRRPESFKLAAPKSP